MIPEMLFFNHLQPYNAPNAYKVRSKNGQITVDPGKFVDSGNITYYRLKRAYTSRYNKTIQPEESCQSMKVTIYGSGYVGLVTGTCLAEVGNDVLCVDIDHAKIDMLLRGEIPIYEPGLDAMVAKNYCLRSLAFHH